MAQAPADPLAAGVAAMQAGRLEEAINSFLQVVQQQPQNEAAWSYLGAAHLQRQEMDHAVGAFRRASTAAPQSARARYNLGYALQAAGRIEDARKAYQEALQLDPGHTQAQQGLASLGPAPEAPPTPPTPSIAPAPVPGAAAPAPPAPAPAAPVPTAQAPAPAPAPPAPAPIPAAPAPADVPPAPVGAAARTQPPPAPVGAPPIQAPPEPEQEEVPLLAQAGGGAPAAAPQDFELGVRPGTAARPMPGPRPLGPSAGPRRPLPSSQPPGHGRQVMTTVGAGLTTGARIGKGVLAGAIAAMGTGVTAAILWALVRLLVEAATKGDKADIKGAGIAALTNAIALIPALLVVGVVIGVIAGAAAKPRLPSFLMVLCALGWGAYSFFVVSKGDVGSLDRAIVPVVAAVVYVFWFGIAFESQFRARAEDVLGKERGRRGRRVT